MSELHPVGWELSSFLSCTITKAFNCTLYQPCRSLIYEATVIMTGIHHLHTPQAHASMYLQQILQSWISQISSDALVAQRPSRISLLGLHRKRQAPVITQKHNLGTDNCNAISARYIQLRTATYLCLHYRACIRTSRQPAALIVSSHLPRSSLGIKCFRLR